MMQTALFISGIGLITAAAVWLDYKTYRQGLRAGLIILSGLLLAGYILEPKIWSYGNDAAYVLITKGTDDSAFPVSGYDSVYVLDEAAEAGTRLPSHYKRISSVFVIGRYLPPGSRIDVLGYGTQEGLPGEYSWGDRLTPPEGGVVLIRAPRQVETGRPFRMQLRLHPASPGDSLIVLRDGTETGNVLRPDSAGMIRLQARIDSEGPVHYQFEWNRRDTTIRESWNIRADDPERLRIATLLYSPLFEVTYLTESLAARGHSVAGRTRVGQDRFRVDALNSSGLPSGDNILDDPGAFDLLILDLREYDQLTISDKNRLKEALANGLDLLLTPPDSENPDPWTGLFYELTGTELSLEPLERLEERQWFPEFLDTDFTDLNRLPMLNLNFRPQNGFTTLLNFQGREPAALKTRVEDGSVSVHLFYQSYNWLLAGRQEIYNRFWAWYLGEIITLEKPVLTIAEPVLSTDRPAVILFSTNFQALEQSLVTVYSTGDGEQITLPGNLREGHPKGGYSLFWPQNPGWHRARYGESEAWFYVYERGWEFDSDFRAFTNTSEQIAGQDAAAVSEPGTRRKLPGWIWLSVFLCLQSLLWIERKVSRL